VDAYSRLKKYTRAPTRQNLRGFRRAAAKLDLATAQFKLLSTIKRQSLNPTTTPITTTDLEKTYAQLVNLLLAAQANSPHPTNLPNLTKQVSAATAFLAAQAIYFHLNFFKPNFLGAAHSTDFQKCLKEMVRLFANKNRDYGNSFRFWGVPGLLVRLGDKIFRLKQLQTKNYRRKVAGEKIPDTALDLANYALMLLLLLAEDRSPKLGH
jgi:hypothetical protein